MADRVLSPTERSRQRTVALLALIDATLATTVTPPA